jgi:hypothetical protein
MSHAGHSSAGTPIAQLGWSARDIAILTIARHYCAAFARPEGLGWIAAVSSALADFGDEAGPGIAVAVLGVVQTMRRARESAFSFNAPGCASCAARVTGNEWQLMMALRASLRGQTEAAAAHAAILCEANDPAALMRMMVALRQQLDRAPCLA